MPKNSFVAEVTFKLQFQVMYTVKKAERPKIYTPYNFFEIVKIF